MITVSTADPAFNRAWSNAFCALPVERLETPRQYGARWREAYRCRVVPGSAPWPNTEYVFDHNEDYVWFMIKWS